LVLVVVRLLWRALNPVPQSSSLPLWQRRAAQATHSLLYLLLLALPLLGWASAASRAWSIDFGMFALPPVLPANPRLGGKLGDIHTFTAYALLALVGLHVLAALYHRFWARDSVLERMLPTWAVQIFGNPRPASE